ncbi:hypothetical protein C362_02084 [Cryptococcus neoformans Bt1]|nr:hypothetical protein C362_02084 [Cryptococcus neoformans var. grubii Bt1]
MHHPCVNPGGDAGRGVSLSGSSLDARRLKNAREAHFVEWKRSTGRSTVISTVIEDGFFDGNIMMFVIMEKNE